jgi:membrane protein
MPTATRKRRTKATRKRRARSRNVDLRSVALELAGAFRKRELLVYASGTAFQVLSSIVPFLLFGLGLVGFLHLGELWRDHLAPSISPHVSAAGFTVIDTTVTKVLTHKQVFWVTAGFALAMWEVSGAVRVMMRGLDRIYDVEDKRSGTRRILVSLALAFVLSALVLAAIAVVWLTPLAYGEVSGAVAAVLFVMRWGLAALLLGLAVGLIDRFAPDARQPVGWVSFGTALMVGAWIVVSIAYGLYLRYIASPGSIFGALASVVILIAYVYLSTIVYFAGAQADAIVRRRVEGNARGR